MKFNYKVFPPNPLSLKGTYKVNIDYSSIVGLSFIIAIMAGIIGIIIGIRFYILFWIVLFGSGMLLSAIRYVRQDSAEYKLRVKEASNQVEALSNQLNNNLEISERLVKHDLPTSLERASEFLNQAKIEYNDNAFGPFWDCVEEAARNLASFNDIICKLSQSAENYYNSLYNIEHNFPVFFPAHEDLPDPKPILEELEVLVRKGQTNFQFAIVWEHRETREVLIAGFHTLGEAISNLALTVEGSFDELNTSISTNISRLVEEQIRSRESFEKHAKNQEQLIREQN